MHSVPTPHTLAGNHTKHTHCSETAHTHTDICTHKHTTKYEHSDPECLPKPKPSVPVWLQNLQKTHTHTHRVLPCHWRKGQHSRPNSSTRSADGESYWRNILYRSRPRGSTTTDSTWPLFTLALHFVLGFPPSRLLFITSNWRFSLEALYQGTCDTHTCAHTLWLQVITFPPFSFFSHYSLNCNLGQFFSGMLSFHQCGKTFMSNF